MKYLLALLLAQAASAQVSRTYYDLKSSVDGIASCFTLPATPSSSSAVEVIHDDLTLTPTSEWTFTPPATICVSPAPPANTVQFGAYIYTTTGGGGSSAVANSTWSYLSNPSTDSSDPSWTALGNCIKSTVTVTIGASTDIVHFNFRGTWHNTNPSSTERMQGILDNGSFFDGESTTVGLLNRQDCAGNLFCNVSFSSSYTGFSAGTHSFCLTVAAFSGSNGGSMQANYQFTVEVPAQ